MVVKQLHLFLYQELLLFHFPGHFFYILLHVYEMRHVRTLYSSIYLTSWMQ